MTQINKLVRGTLGRRPDRLATLYVSQPLHRSVPFKEARIPILMYHSLSETGLGSVNSYYETVTSPHMFADQMKLLHESGYKAISVSEAFQCVRDVRRHLAKLVVITFDDGYRDFMTHGLAVLRKYGFCATIF